MSNTIILKPKWGDTGDGRNPAPVHVENLPLFTKFYTFHVIFLWISSINSIHQTMFFDQRALGKPRQIREGLEISAPKGGGHLVEQKCAKRCRLWNQPFAFLWPSSAQKVLLIGSNSRQAHCSSG